jgi:hypothetical protein
VFGSELSSTIDTWREQLQGQEHSSPCRNASPLLQAAAESILVVHRTSCSAAGPTMHAAACIVVYSCGSHFGQHNPASPARAQPKFPASRGIWNVPSRLFRNFQAHFVGRESTKCFEAFIPNPSEPKHLLLSPCLPPEIDSATAGRPPSPFSPWLSNPI